MKYIIGSFISYVAVYFLLCATTIEAINWKVNTPTSFEEIRMMSDAFTSWGTHNLLFVLSFIVVNYAASFFCGAVISLKNKVNLGLIFSVIVILIEGYIYFSVSEKVRLETTFSVGPYNNNEFPISSWVAICSHLISGYIGFIHGNEFENTKGDRKILRIVWYHWIWILFPLIINPIYIILVNFFYSIILLMDFYSKHDANFITHFFSGLFYIPIIVSLFTLTKFHEYLINKDKKPFSVKRLAFGFSILVCGILAGVLSQGLINLVEGWAQKYF